MSWIIVMIVAHTTCDICSLDPSNAGAVSHVPDDMDMDIEGKLTLIVFMGTYLKERVEVMLVIIACFIGSYLAFLTLKSTTL